MTAKLLLVGCGNMGQAMLAGWIRAGVLLPSEVSVVEPNADLAARATGSGVSVHADASGLEAGLAPQMILFAVKPQVMREILPRYRALAGPDTTIASVAAGIRIAVFEDCFGADRGVIRCMPNTPAAIGKGMMVTVANAAASPAARAFAHDLFAANGRVAEIEDEALMDAVTAVSGSGPAYVFHFIECLRDAGIAAGLPLETAALLAMQTVHGAAALAAESGTEPGRLREQVTSPNGTTAAALAVLMGPDALPALVREAVEAARRRSVELG